MAAEIKKRYGVEPELVAGSKGIFDVSLDGSVIYSKDETGVFPRPREIFDKVDART